MCVGPTAETKAPTSLGLSFLSGSTLETQRLECVRTCAAKRRGMDGDLLAEAEAAPPALNPGKRTAYLSH